MNSNSDSLPLTLCGFGILNMRITAGQESVP